MSNTCSQCADAGRIFEHVRTFTEDIGVRLAGSAAEHRAAEYAKTLCESFGAKCSIEEYPVNSQCAENIRLEILMDGEWKQYPTTLFGSAPTTGGKTLEADLVLFDSATGYQADDISFLHDKAVIHLGCHLKNSDCYRRLMEADPKFMLFVDIRYPGILPLADGLFPAQVARYGARPTMNVAYMDALSWISNHATKARLCVGGCIRKSTTPVVIAEFPGDAGDDRVIYAGCHLDTQAATVGATDNAAGCAVVLELARLLSQTSHKATYKLCFFGAEEQLSLGSSSYVRTHREEISKRGVFMLNFDSCGSSIGWNTISTVASFERVEQIRLAYKARKMGLAIEHAAEAFLDSFPFAAAGVPAATLGRDDCTAGQFNHHRADDVIEYIDPTVMAKIVDIAVETLSQISESENEESISEMFHGDVEKLWDEIFGGWK
ncbi:MAG: M28 family peptidase [Victivallaceae bacterium]|nr:M28 family peptidase [Victivallaceae bacterium]